MNTDELAQKEIQEVLNKYGLQIKYKFDFPIYKILPDEVILAQKILAKHGLKIIIELEPKPKNK
jgi:hypothetical protein